MTTATVRGTVRSSDGALVDGARVTIESKATGFSVEVDVRRGRFVVQGLEVGGPYTVIIRKDGHHAEQRDGLFLTLGEPLDLRIDLRSDARPLDTLTVVSSAPRARLSPNAGTATTITDSMLQRLPTLNRDMFDFVRLVPQISTRTGFRTGFSGGGAGLRYNNFMINGVSERTVYVGGTAAYAGGRSVPFGAVKEYQILLAPYDVRYGDFAGAFVNTVTRAGSNRFEASAFAYGRNDQLGRRADDGTTTPYDRVQYGLSLGGPIIRDRLHFFVVPEFQHFTSAAAGPYLGQPTSASTPVPITAPDLTRLESILRKYSLQAGSAGAVENLAPVAHVFARLDLAIPAWNSRAMLWTNHSRFSSNTFSRPARDSFPLSTFQTEMAVAGRLTSLQLQTTTLRLGGAHNELIVAHSSNLGESLADAHQPLVRVSVPGITGGAQLLITGTHPVAQGQFTRTLGMRVSDNLTLPLGVNHTLTLGIAAEQFRVRIGGVLGSYGTWTFSSLDSLDRGLAQRFEIARDFGTASVPMHGRQYSAYIGDRWLAADHVVATLGARADLLAPSGRAPYQPEVDSIFGRRTDAKLPRRVQWSPRAAFTWDIGGKRRNQIRGGIGVFSGRPPMQWFHATLANYGVGIGRLTCGTRPTYAGPAPAFDPDYRAPPTACANGAKLNAARGDVELLDPNVSVVRLLRGSLAWDRRLPWGLVASGEALLTRNLSDLLFVNLNLEGPQAVDRTGRVLYGAFAATGIAAPRLRSRFPGVIELTYTSRNRAIQLSGRVDKKFASGAATTASYTYSRVRDAATPVRTLVRGQVNWSARAVSGRHDDIRAGISQNDVPHRFILAGNYRAPWQRWFTELSFYYVGESGSPFTYIAGGAGSLGDLNADGSDVNDPVYVPRSAHDTTEVRFTGRSAATGADNSAEAQAARIRTQQDAFDRFVRRTPCLERQRGRILERNSCREPWAHTTVAAVRQGIPLGGRSIDVELQILNMLNLLHHRWGQRRVANPELLAASSSLLEHVQHTTDVSQPVFRFQIPQWTTLPAESNFQLQLGLRYQF